MIRLDKLKYWEESNLTIFKPENNLNNSHVSIVNIASYRASFINKFGYALYPQYAWVISYFKTIYRTDYKEHGNETRAMQNATEWLRNQFNPLIVDHTPPIITKFKLTWIIVTDSNFPYVHLYAHVHVSVWDVGRIEWVNVTDKNNGEVWANYVGSTFFDDQYNFSASLLNGTLGSVRINLTTYDHAGNCFYGEKKLDGLVDASLNILAALWGQFWNTLVAVGKAIARAANVILKWIEAQVKEIISNILSPIVNSINSFGSTLSITLESIYSKEEGNPNNIELGDLERINKLLMPLWVIGILLGTGFVALAMFLTGVTMGVSALLSAAISFVISEIIITLFGNTISQKYNLDITHPIGVSAILELMASILHIEKRAMLRENMMAYSRGHGHFSQLWQV